MEKPYSPVFVNSCQPGPARSSPARLDKNKASPLQPSPVTKKASPTIPAMNRPWKYSTFTTY